MRIKFFSALLFILLVSVSSSIHAQVMVKGRVVEEIAGGATRPIPSAVVVELQSSIYHEADSLGGFEFTSQGPFPIRVVVSFTGFTTDTFQLESAGNRALVLKASVSLREVTIQGKQSAIGYSTIKPINVETVTSKELAKAACCNLSEAFESSPTVNVAYTDAVTGAKEIRLLGLSGVYSQLLTEVVPNYRGIAGSYGLYFIPGPWMESIQVTKGSGSVVQGYEATSGQINVEFKKPYDEELPRNYINLFAEQNGNLEANFHIKRPLNKKWSTILMGHGNYMEGMQDQQDDGFLDIPHARQLNFYNRWQYDSGKKLESQIGARFVYDRRSGGQYASHHSGSSQGLYLTDVLNRRAELFGKLGILFPDHLGRSIGNILQGTFHDLNSSFGLRTYNAQEKTLYAQSLFEDQLGAANKRYMIGVGYRYDAWNESVDDTSYRSVVESVPGVLAEYTYEYIDKFSIVAGSRLDHHNLYGLIYTPRLHMRYNFTPDFIVRLSGGRSFRVPNLYADNISIFASSRSVQVLEDAMPERAWNYGFNVIRKFEINGRPGSVNLDAYRTEFMDQLVVDRVTSFDKVLIYNLKGVSYSNSAQLAFNWEAVERLDLRLAYKLDDVRTTYSGSLQRKPLVPRDRVLFNLAYRTGNEHWRFDYTLVREGVKRLLPTYSDPVIPELGEYSPVFYTMNLQVTKVFRSFEVYFGSENLLNYIQEYPIVNANDPFGSEFDATNVWAPLDGRRIYAGLRLPFN
ncbi:MAG: TonB-dependent receptor domain-containing protein [Bacteroidota bacterium]